MFTLSSYVSNVTIELFIEKIAKISFISVKFVLISKMKKLTELMQRHRRIIAIFQKMM